MLARGLEERERERWQTAVVERAPLDDPLSYPGVIPDGSFLLAGSEVTPLEPLIGRAVAERLAELGTAPVEERHAVVAVGSNASPAQLSRKWAGQPCSDVVVGIRAVVSGLQVLPSAHLSLRGYWPFAPAAGTGATSLVVCLVEEQQLSVLDATEPNYDRIRIDTWQHPVVLADGTKLATCEVYESRHGVVDDPRLPPLLPGPTTQRDLLQILIDALPDLPGRGVTDPERLVAAVRAEPELTRRVTALLPGAFRVRPAGLSRCGQRTGKFETPAVSER